MADLGNNDRPTHDPAPVPGTRLLRAERGIRAVGWGGYIALFALMAHVTLDVSLRKGFNAPLTGTIEYVQYWYMVPMVFTGLVIAQQAGEHIDAPLIVDKLPQEMRRNMYVFALLLTAIVVAGIGWWGWHSALEAYEIAERGGAARVLVWPMRFFVPLGAVAYLLQLVVDARRFLIGVRGPFGESPAEGADDGR